MKYTYKILKLDRYDTNGEIKDRDYYNSILIDDVLEALDKEIKDKNRLNWNNNLEQYCKHKIENKLSRGEHVDILKYTSSVASRNDYDTNLHKICGSI